MRHPRRSKTLAVSVFAFGISAWFAAFAEAQGRGGFGRDAPVPGDYGAERQWLMDNPDAIRALGELPKEELGDFLQTYRSLPAEEQKMVRDHAADLQQLGPNERKWALDNPDAVRQLGAMSEEDRRKFLETYKSLTPAEKEKLRTHADDLQALSPEDRKWALENPDAVRQLGAMPDGQRDQLLDVYRSLPSDSQDIVRDRMRAR